MRTLIAIASLFVFASHCSATSIVVIFQNTAGQSRIVFGVDGMQALVDGGGKRLGSQPVCKLGSTGGYFYALAGIVVSSNGSYDAYRELAVALSGNGSFSEKVDRIEARLLKELNSIPDWPPNAAVSMVIVNSANFPNYYKGALIRNDSDWQREPESKIVVSIPMDTRIFRLGINDTAPPPSDLLKDPITAVRQLIREQAAKHPTAVGEPISIVEISSSGAHWIDRGACR